MKQLITTKLKLHADATQFQALRATQLAYRDALNHVSRYSFEHGKMSNQIRLRDETYYEIRAKYSLPAQMATNVPRQVGQPTKHFGQRSSKTMLHGKQGIPRNAIRAWIIRLSTFLLRSSITTNEIIA